MIYSYDIFDTLIVRKLASPIAIFSIIEEIILNGETSIDRDKGLYFAEKRVQSERISREISNKENGHIEVLLDDIYKVLQDISSFTSDEIEILKELEVSTEMKYIVGIDENINKVREHILNNQKVILITDMYLPQVYIRRLLKNIDQIFDTIDIYVSGEITKSKRSGNLYEYIKEDLNINYNQWVHVGDNYHSDVEKPKENGIDAYHFQLGSLNESELFLTFNSQYRIKSLLLTQFIYGASRLTRIKHNYSDFYTPYETLGVSFVGPLIYSFSIWLAQMALIDKKSKLFFCARDGYLLKQVFDIIIEKNKLQIKTYYFYTSRVSMIPMSLTLPLNEKQMMYAFENTYYGQLKDFFKGLNLTDTEINTLNDSQNMEKYTRVINSNDLLNTLTKALSLYNEKITAYVIEQQKLFTMYIEQDGYDEESAFVDVGWSGTLQNVINKYISITNKNFVTSGYYVVLNNTFINSLNIKKAYLYLTEHDLSNAKNLQALLEAILPSNHNGVLRYQQDNNKVNAVLKEGRNQYNLWPADKLIEGVKNYAITASNNIDISNFTNLEQLKLLAQYMLIMFTYPSKLIVYTISRIAHTGNLNHDGLRDVAPEFTFKDLKVLEKNRRSYGEHSAVNMHTFWKDASLRRSKGITQCLFYYNSAKFWYKLTKKQLYQKIFSKLKSYLWFK